MFVHAVVVIVIFHFTKAEFYVTSPLSWWDARDDGCSRNGSFFIPRDLSALANELPVLNATQFYWLGAFHAYEPWIWTEDQSPLFEYIGTTATSDVSFKSQEGINGIDAYSCNVKCNDTTYLIGLQGRTCYCLNNVKNNKFLSDGDVSNCSGNVLEFCGGDEQVSVYKRSLPKSSSLNVTLNGDGHGSCAYVSVVKERQLLVQTDSNCSVPRGVVYPNLTNKTVKINGNMYVLSVYTENVFLSFNVASTQFKLAKLTRQNSEDLYRASRRTETYWIGLRRDQRWRWTNGRLLSETDVSLIDSMYQGVTCLAVQKAEDGVRFKAENCETKLTAICYKEGSEAEFPLLVVVYAVGSGVSVTAVLILVLVAYKREILFFRKKSKHSDETVIPLSNGITSRDVTNSLTETKDTGYEDHIYESGESKDPVYTQVIKKSGNKCLTKADGDYDVADIDNGPIRTQYANYKNEESQNSYDHIQLLNSNDYDVAITSNSHHDGTLAAVPQDNETYDHLDNGDR